MLPFGAADPTGRRPDAPESAGSARSRRRRPRKPPGDSPAEPPRTEPLISGRVIVSPGRGSPTPVPGAPVSGGPRHEESPPTGRTGDRAQARSRRRLALEQKRDPPLRPMRRAGRRRRPAALAAPPRAREPTRKGRELPRRGRVVSTPRPALAASPRARPTGTDGTANPRRCKSARLVVRPPARTLSRMSGRTEGGLLPSVRSPAERRRQRWQSRQRQWTLSVGGSI